MTIIVTMMVYYPLTYLFPYFDALPAAPIQSVKGGP